MTSVKTTLLDAIQRRVKSIMQPLYNEQRNFRSEVSAVADDTRKNVEALDSAVRDLTIAVLNTRWNTAPNLLASRNEVGHWLNWLGLAGQGVEVGVLTGVYSSKLLETWEGRLLISVDPWREFPSEEYIDSCNVLQQQQDLNHDETSARLKRFGGRSKILRLTSSEAAATIQDGSLDFVYLDAQHHYEAVRDDIALWSPKLKSRGVIGGHDFIDGSITSGLYGVKKAVTEFAAETGSNLIVTCEPNWPSWFIRVG